MDTPGYRLRLWGWGTEKLLEWGEAVRKVALELIRIIEGAGREEEAV